MIYDRQKKKNSQGGSGGQPMMNLRSEVMSAGQPNLTQRKQLLTTAQALQPAEADNMLDGSKKVSLSGFYALEKFQKHPLTRPHFAFSMTYRRREVVQDRQTRT